MRKDGALKKAFDDAMTVRNRFYTVAWHEKFPARSRLSEIQAKSAAPPVIVDIGGNQGIDLQGLAEKYPDFQCELILQDLPETIQRIQPGLDKRIRPTVYDFFTPQPVKGMDCQRLTTCSEQQLTSVRRCYLLPQVRST